MPLWGESKKKNSADNDGSHNGGEALASCQRRVAPQTDAHNPHLRRGADVYKHTTLSLRLSLCIRRCGEVKRPGGEQLESVFDAQNDTLVSRKKKKSILAVQLNGFNSLDRLPNIVLEEFETAQVFASNKTLLLQLGLSFA